MTIYALIAPDLPEADFGLTTMVVFNSDLLVIHELRIDSHKPTYQYFDLKNRVPPYKGQTASRRSVEIREVRDLHYAALLF